MTYRSGSNWKSNHNKTQIRSQVYLVYIWHVDYCETGFTNRIVFTCSRYFSRYSNQFHFICLMQLCKPNHIYWIAREAVTHIFLMVELYKCPLDVSVPLQAWSGPEGSRKLRFPDFMTTAQEGSKFVSHTHRPLLPPGNSPGTHFC